MGISRCAPSPLQIPSLSLPNPAHFGGGCPVGALSRAPWRQNTAHCRAGPAYLSIQRAPAAVGTAAHPSAPAKATSLSVWRQEQLRPAFLSGCVPPSRETVRGRGEGRGRRGRGQLRAVQPLLDHRPPSRCPVDARRDQAIVLGALHCRGQRVICDHMTDDVTTHQDQGLWRDAITGEQVRGGPSGSS